MLIFLRKRAPFPVNAVAGRSKNERQGTQIAGMNESFGNLGRYGLLFLSLAWSTAGITDNSVPDRPPKHDLGWSYIHDELPEVPWSVHIIRIERSHHELEFCTTLGNGQTQGMSTVSEQVKRLAPELGRPVAAINGDFYNKQEGYPGDPRDLQICRGELVSSPTGHTCFWVDTAGNPRMTNIVSRFRAIWPDGTATPFGLNEERPNDGAVLYTSFVGPSTHTSGGVEFVLESTTNSAWLPLRAGQIYVARVREVQRSGDAPLGANSLVLSIGPKLASHLPKVEQRAVLRIATETLPDLTGVNAAIGGGPTLVRDGRAKEWHGFQMRHPRVALGWNKDFIFMVEVDGRQSNLSVGMSFSELATYMIKLGCEQALNLDGGGSATLWVCGNVMNSPSEGHERPGANALVLVQRKDDAKSTSESRNLANRSEPLATDRQPAEH